MDLNKEFTITKDQFLKASAEALNTDRMKELVRIQPSLILFAATYSAEVATALFDKENIESEDMNDGRE